MVIYQIRMFFVVLVTSLLSVTNLFSQKISSEDSLLVAKYQERVAFFQSNNFDSTIFYLNKLEDLPLQGSQRARLNLDLGNTFLYKGELHFAMKYYLKVKEYGKQNNDYLYETAGNISIATIYIRKDEFSKAIKLLKEAEGNIINYNPSNDSEGLLKTKSLLTIYINQSLSLVELKEYGSATTYIDKAISLSDSVNDTYNLAIAYSDKANILESYSKYDDAIRLHHKALSLRKKDDVLLDITRSYNNLGKTYYDYQKNDSAYYYLLKGFKDSKKLDLVFDIYTSSKLLSNLYFRDSDFENSYKYLDISYTYKDRYMDIEKMSEITDLNYEYKIKILNNEQDTKERRLYATIAILLLLFVVAMLLYFLQRKVMERNKIAKDKLILNNKLVEEKLEYKNKQLVTNVMHQISRNELLLQVSGQLKVLSDDLNQKQKSSLNRIIRELKNANDSSMLTEFEHAFQDVHIDFYNKLDNLFSLTPSERRMAAFIRLNLSSKEISSITGQSVRTIDVTRYRLRKKLNISNTDINLSTFLAKL